MLRLCSDSSRSYPGRSVSHAVKLTVTTPGSDLPGNQASRNLPGHGPALLMKRPVRTRMQGVVGAGGEKPPATRLCD